jgi:activating signal cointegrator 1
MKVLSLQQPWASLVALQHKWIETRSWRTSHRGWLAIHASKSFPPYNREICYLDCFYEALWQFYGDGHDSIAGPMRAGYVEKSLPLGSVVAVAELHDCVRIGARRKTYPAVRDGHTLDVPIPPHLCTTENLFGDYTPGRYAWVFSQIRALDKPIPVCGRLGLWEMDHPMLDEACGSAVSNGR